MNTNFYLDIGGGIDFGDVSLLVTAPPGRLFPMMVLVLLGHAASNGGLLEERRVVHVSSQPFVGSLYKSPSLCVLLQGRPVTNSRRKWRSAFLLLVGSLYTVN